MKITSIDLRSQTECIKCKLNFQFAETKCRKLPSCMTLLERNFVIKFTVTQRT